MLKPLAVRVARQALTMQNDYEGIRESATAKLHVHALARPLVNHEHVLGNFQGF